MGLAPPSELCASCHTQHGGGRGLLRSLSGSQVAHSIPVMAAPQQNADSGALETCGLERILEALKLLLNPGGERTDLGAGLHSGLSGRPVFKASIQGLPVFQCAPQALPGNSDRPARFWALSVLPHTTVEETEVPGGTGSVEYWY